MDHCPSATIASPFVALPCCAAAVLLVTYALYAACACAMVRLCSELVTALTGAPAEEHPPSAAASAAHPRTPRYVSLVLPLRSATLRQDTGSPSPIWLAGGDD